MLFYSYFKTVVGKEVRVMEAETIFNCTDCWDIEKKKLKKTS